jgi:hypothetical protein
VTCSGCPARVVRDPAAGRLIVEASPCADRIEEPSTALYARHVLAVLVFIALVAVVAVLSRRGTGRRVRVRSCCSAAPWPPDDLTDRPAAGRAPRA